MKFIFQKVVKLGLEPLKMYYSKKFTNFIYYNNKQKKEKKPT